MKRLALPLILLAAAASPAAGQRTLDERRDAAADARVQIATISRDLRLVAWDRDEVRVSGEIDEEYERLRIEGDARDLTIRVEPIRNRSRSRRDSEGPIEVRVPARASLQARTVSGDIGAGGFTRSVDVASTSGDIAIRGRPRAVQAESVSGDVEVEGAGESLRVSSVSGDLQLRTSGAIADVKTVSGDLVIDAGEPVRNGTFRAMSGDISFRGSFAQGAVAQFESHSGEVVLELPDGVDAAFDVSTFSGEIVNQFGPEPRRTSRYTPEKSLSFTAGNGSARVAVKSFSGEVRLVRR